MRNWEDKLPGCISIYEVETHKIVQTPEKLELHTNKEMAKELGIDISSLKVENRRFEMNFVLSSLSEGLLCRSWRLVFT